MSTFVTVSLATGARRLARRRVIVKRLVCIEDLGTRVSPEQKSRIILAQRSLGSAAVVRLDCR